MSVAETPCAFWRRAEKTTSCIDGPAYGRS
jgi:hypothetical protein